MHPVRPAQLGLRPRGMKSRPGELSGHRWTPLGAETWQRSRHIREDPPISGCREGQAPMMLWCSCHAGSPIGTTRRKSWECSFDHDDSEPNNPMYPPNLQVCIVILVVCLPRKPQHYEPHDRCTTQEVTSCREYTFKKCARQLGDRAEPLL